MLCTSDYIVNPVHRITVVLVGVGGTGSFVLPELVSLSNTLKILDRKELKIIVYDDDIVEEHNVGRQKFFPSDIGKSKAETLVNRVNRAYGTDVEFRNETFSGEDLERDKYNIVISCVDNVRTRKIIDKAIKKNGKKGNYHGQQRTHYWIDCGNSRDYGQIILSAYGKETKMILPSIIDLHPNMEDKVNEPSCSLRASLREQSFMINKLTGVYALEMLSSLLLDFNILQSQIYFSLNPINVKTNKI